MSFLLHQQALNKLCRVCRRLTTKHTSSTAEKHTYQCINYAKELETVFSINIWRDDALVHPSTICWRCERSLRHERSGSRSGTRESASQKWEKHSRVRCNVCETYKTQQRGGRPQKRKRNGNGLNQKEATVPPPLSFNCSQVSSEQMPHNLDVLNNSGEATLFICTICQCILGKPTVQTPCEHNFCADCLLAWFKHSNSTTVPCPVCNSSVEIHNVNPCSRILRVQLTTLPTVCIACGTIGKLELMKTHICAQEQPKPTAFTCYASDPLPGSEPTNECDVTTAARLLKSMASKHIKGTPIPPEIEAATDRWTVHKLRENPCARLKTPGRVNVVSFTKGN